MVRFSQLLPAFLNSASGAGEGLYSEYAGITVPAFNIVFEGLTLVLLVGAAVAGILLIRQHIRQWLFPLFVGVIFNLVFRYVLFNQRFGAVILAFSFLADKVEFFGTHPLLLNLILLVLEIGITFLTYVLGMAYWRKSSLKENRPFVLGGAIAFGFSFYLVGLFTNDYLTQMYQLISESHSINTYGFDAMIKNYMDAGAGYEESEVIAYLLSLTDQNRTMYVHFVLEAVVMILGAFPPIAASVIHYAVLSGRLEKKWYAASAAIIAMTFLPTVLVLLTGHFTAFIYVELAFSAILAAGSVLLVLYLAKTYMETEWKAMAYTRTMQKRDEEKARQKIPKIVMPKD